MAWRSWLSQEYRLPVRVSIFDTTLRDGEQTPGVALTAEAKLEIAKALDELGVDVIEAGFPMVSEGEAQAVKLIAKEGLNAKICALARTSARDIDAALSAEVDWIHIFIATSDIHLKHKLQMTREQVLEFASAMTEYAKDHGLVVHFSAEDATRTELDFLLEVFKTVEEAGADSIDIPDTTGFAVPTVMRRIVSAVKKAVKIPVAVHCHDDMGLAVANSLAGVEVGAEIIHATINGLGERAGNTSLEELVVALHTLYGVETGIRLEKIYAVSRLVEKLTGIIVPKNKAVVGDNAFSHESGIHVHGILGSPQTYEPIMPETVGRERKIILGKHSGRHSVEALAKQYGLTLTENRVKDILLEVKRAGDAGGKISDAEFLEIIRKVAGEVFEHRPLSLIEASFMGSPQGFSAILSIKYRGEHLSFGGYGRNEVEAAVSACLDMLSQLNFGNILDYKIWPTYYFTGFSEAEAVLETGGRRVTGKGVHPDPAVAVIHAVVNALNQVLVEGVAVH